jgi:transposase
MSTQECEAWYHRGVKSDHVTNEQREWQRRRAFTLWQHGWWQKDIARALGVSEGAVSGWIKRGREGGEEALKTRSRPGPTLRLIAEQRAQVPELLARGAEAWGYRGDVWTCRRIADIIQRTFGVRYSAEHIRRLLQTAGWSVQQPIERATQRHEPAIEQWYAERWPAINIKAAEEGYTIVWVDESGFYLLPHVVRTWAPRGETPVLRVKLTRDHLSAISGLTLDGRLFLQVQEAAYTAEAVVGFVRQLLRQICGKVLVIWDGSPIHKGQPIKDYLAAGAAKQLHLERLPGYAPDLNPAEGIWSYLKRVELKNRCCRDFTELRRELHWATARLRHKHTVLRGCSTRCGYSV